MKPPLMLTDMDNKVIAVNYDDVIHYEPYSNSCKLYFSRDKFVEVKNKMFCEIKSNCHKKSTPYSTPKPVRLPSIRKLKEESEK